MKETIKNYSELKQLINHGDKVTLDGKLMTNEKVNSMPMAEVRLCIEQGDFKTDSAIEGEFIGKDDQPKYPSLGNGLGRLVSGAEMNRQQDAARAQYQSTMANAQMQAQMTSQALRGQSKFYNGLGGLGQAPMGGIFGGLF